MGLGLGAPGVGGAGGAPAGALPVGFPIGWGTLGEDPFFPPLTIFWLAMLKIILKQTYRKTHCDIARCITHYCTDL